MGYNWRVREGGWVKTIMIREEWVGITGEIRRMIGP